MEVCLKNLLLHRLDNLVIQKVTKLELKGFRFGLLTIGLYDCF